MIIDQQFFLDLVMFEKTRIKGRYDTQHNIQSIMSSVVELNVLEQGQYTFIQLINSYADPLQC